MPEEFEGPEGPDNLDVPPSFFPYDRGARPEPIEPVELVEVRIDGVYAAETGGQISRFVLLSDGDGRKLPIMIGPFEAQAIQTVLERRREDRPMTHDLIRNILDRFSSVVDRVVIDDMWSTTYYAKLYIRNGSEEMEIDSRPSDGIAMAVRFEAPIFVADTILEAAVSGE